MPVNLNVSKENLNVLSLPIPPKRRYFETLEVGKAQCGQRTESAAIWPRSQAP